MKVIGITGESPVNGVHAGKDTAARFLREHLEEHGLRVRVQAWADKLKVMAARSLGFKGTEQECIEFCDQLKITGIVRIDPTGEYGDTWEISGREFLEFMGTEGGRQVLGPNVWVDATLPRPAGTLEQVDEASKWRARTGFPNVVIDTTTRFPNEVARIREWDGKIIRIERPGVENPPGEHVSKYGIPVAECDAVIENSGTLDDLRENVIAAFHALETMPV